MSDLVWSRLGAEHDADISLDRAGGAVHDGGVSAALRDLARFGQMLLGRGAYGKYRFLSEETFARMLPHKLTEVLGPQTTKVFGIGLDGGPRKFGHGAASAATFQIDRDRDMVVVMTRNKMGKNQEKYNGKFHQAIEEGLAEPVVDELEPAVAVPLDRGVGRRRQAPWGRRKRPHSYGSTNGRRRVRG